MIQVVIFEELLKAIDVIGKDVVDNESIKPIMLNIKLESVGLSGDLFVSLLDYGLLEYSEAGELKFSTVFSKIYNSQKEVLADRVFLFKDIVYRRYSKGILHEIFELFLTYERAIPLEAIRYSDRMKIQELVAVRILKMTEDFDVLVDRDLPEFIKWLEGKEMSYEQLEIIQNNQLMIGELAEQIALEYEVARLQNEGLKTEANNVKLIAKTHLLAGYDIKSFTGSSLSYNRFIEVKAINSGVFYLSKNEREKALILKDKYFLYLVNTDTKDIEVIKDPISRIDQHYNMEPTEFKYTIT